MANVYDISGGTGGRRGMTAQEQLAQALLQQGLSGGPVYHPMQGIGRIGQALAGAYLGRVARDEQEAEQSKSARALGEAAALTAGGRPGGMQSTGGAGGDQVADVPTVSPGLAGLQEALRVHAGNPGVMRAVPQLMQLAQAYEKDRTPTYQKLSPGEELWSVPKTGGTPERVAQGPEKPKARPLTSEEKAEYGIPPDAVAQWKPDGSMNVVFKPPAPPQPPRDSVSADFVLPILRKVQAGEQLTPEDQKAFDMYTRTSPMDQLFRSLMPQQSSAAPSAAPAGAPLATAPAQAAPAAAPPPAAAAAPANGRGVSVPVEQEMIADRDTTIPGVGKVRKGESVIFNPADGTYRKP